MNWKTFTTLSRTASKFLLPLYVLLCLATTVPAERVNIEDYLLLIEDDVFLRIEEGHLAIGDPSGPSNYNDFALTGIIVEKDGSLSLHPLTMVHVSGGYVAVDGTIIVPSTIGTGIYNSTAPWDGTGNFAPDKPTFFHVDGGTVKIELGDSPVLMADTINVNLYKGGGTIDVASGITFQSGEINESESGGDIAKIGGGTWEVGKVMMTGVFEVNQGKVIFLEDTVVGKLGNDIGTVISGIQNDEGNKTFVKVLEGGGVSGTIENVGMFLLEGGTFTFEGGQHTIDRIGIMNGATIDIETGTRIQLNAEDTKETYDDIVVQGTLRISSAAEGFHKGTLARPLPTHITVVGSVNDMGELVNGIIEIYKSDPDLNTIETVNAETIHTVLLVGGKTIVESNVVFESGNISFVTGGEAQLTGASLIVSGGGTYRTGDVSIGGGYLIVEGNGTTLESRGDITAGWLHNEIGTTVITGSDAVFSVVEIVGIYEGQGNNLTIKQGGWIGGRLTGVNELIFEEGNLSLAILESADLPLISVNKFTIVEPEITRVRVLGGTSGETYENVIRVTDENSRKALLDVLGNSNTALYRSDWTENGNALDLALTLYTVQEYISNEWGKKGQNIDNVGRLIDQNISRFHALYELSDEEIQKVIRHAMAGELVGNAMRLAMHQPAHTVFRHLDTVAPLRSPFVRQHGTRGQVREGFNLWFNAYGQAEYARKDAVTFDGYDMTRHGFYLGGDVEIKRRAVAGVVFGYSNPHLKSALGKVSADDYTAGVYFRVPTVWDVMLNGFVGFGSQDYQYRNPLGGASFDGSSLFASAELSRSFPFAFPIAGERNVGRLTPLIAVDFQSASMDGFIIRDPILTGVRIEPESLDTTFLRLGLLSDFWRLRTRLQYMRQLAGDDYVTSSTSLVGSNFVSSPVPIRSVQWGKDWMNVGIGYDVLVTRHWHIIADYNFDLGKRTTSHLGSINAALKW